MVATRKQPTVPPAPISRSSSTQPIPTRRPNPWDLTPYEQRLANPPNKSKNPQGPVEKPQVLVPKPRRPRSWIDRIFLLSLFLFAGYSFLLCRTNSYFSNPDAPEPLLCRSLAMYRSKVLEPYVIPPITHTFHFSHKVAKPLIDKGKEQLEPYVTPITHSFNVVRPHVTRAQHTASDLWHDTIAPFFRDTVHPWWSESVVPRWERYAMPVLEPIQAKSSFYWRFYISNPVQRQYAVVASHVEDLHVKHVQPIVLAVQPRVSRVAHTVRDTTLQVTHLYGTYVHPALIKTWSVLHPYLCQLSTISQRFLLAALDFTIVQGRKTVQLLGRYRRTYVDPHLARIWERAAERNSSTFNTDSVPSEGTTASVPQPTPAAVIETDTTPVPVTPVPSQENTHPGSSIASPEETIGDEDFERLPVNSQSQQEHEHQVEEAARAVSVAEESAHGASTVVHELEREVEASLGVEPEAPTPDMTPESTVLSTPTPAVIPDPVDAPAPQAEDEIPVDPEQNPIVAQAEPVTPAPSATAVSSVPGGVSAEAITSDIVEEDDLDDFLKDLGVDPSGNSAPSANEENIPEPDPTPEVPEPETEEAKAARLAATAAKREEITTRHANWQAQIDRECIDQGHLLVSTLEQLRGQAVHELDNLGWGKTSPQEKRTDKGGILAEVQNEGNRLLKGLESFLKKADARSSTWKFGEGDSDAVKDAKRKSSEEEKAVWTSVAGKVQDKMDEKIEFVRQKVYEWYTGIQNAELQQAHNHAAVVKQLGERAQANLSLDYAWLDDVTYQDWQRFHDLLRTYDKFLQTALAIQNGTSVDPVSPPDVVMDGLDALHADLEDSVLGFQVAFGAVKARAFEIFSVYVGGEGDDDGFFSVKDGEVRRDDLRGVDLGSLGIKEKEVHILPIKDDVDESPMMIGDPAFDASQVVVGKSAAQVEEALKNAPPVEDVRSRHEEL